jgi:hypothetical protein
VHADLRAGDHRCGVSQRKVVVGAKISEYETTRYR